MGRGRVELKRIQNPSSRQLTFTKRRHGLLKKASELSVLCDAEVSLIIFSATGKISEFASHDMNRTLGKYQKCTSTTKDDNNTIGNMKFLRSEMESMQKKLDALEATQKHLIGEDLGSLSLNELQRLERQVKAAGSRIHSRKNQVFSEHIGSLRRKLRLLQHENTVLKKLSEDHKGGGAPLLSLNIMVERVHDQLARNVPPQPSSLPEEAMHETSLHLSLPQNGY